MLPSLSPDTPAPLTAEHEQEQEQEPYRDDVRGPLTAAGWTENEDGHLIAPNGALWTELNAGLDTGVTSPDRKWCIEFDSGVTASVIVAAALAAGGTSKPAPLTAEHEQMLRELVACTTDIDAVTASPGILTTLLTEIDRLRDELDRQTGLAEQGARANRELKRLRSQGGAR